MWPENSQHMWCVYSQIMYNTEFYYFIKDSLLKVLKIEQFDVIDYTACM